MRRLPRIILLLAATIMANSTLADSGIKTIPSITGPEVYELYTDARFFITHVYVNGNKRRLSNAEGGGMRSNNRYSVSGDLGYRNKVLLNAHLQPGKNIIKVIFEPSSVLLQAREQGDKAELHAIRDMFAHAVISRGQLSDSSSGISSYELDELIESKDRKSEILLDKLLRRFSKDQLSEEVSVVYELDTRETDISLKGNIDECELNSTWFVGGDNFTGELYINDVLTVSIEGSSSSNKVNDMDQLREGNNTIKLVVNELHIELESPQTIDFVISCDLREQIKAIGFSEEYRNLSFGDFFNKSYVTLTSIEFEDTGEFESSFVFKK